MGEERKEEEKEPLPVADAVAPTQGSTGFLFTSRFEFESRDSTPKSQHPNDNTYVQERESNA